MVATGKPFDVLVPDEGGNQKSSAAHPPQSTAIRRNQTQSDAIRRNQTQSDADPASWSYLMKEAIRRHSAASQTAITDASAQSAAFTDADRTQRHASRRRGRSGSISAVTVPVQRYEEGTRGNQRAISVKSSFNHRAIIVQSSCNQRAISVQLACNHRALSVKSSCTQRAIRVQSACTCAAIRRGR